MDEIKTTRRRVMRLKFYPGAVVVKLMMFILVVWTFMIVLPILLGLVEDLMSWYIGHLYEMKYAHHR